jgi:hypothetical protein
MGFCSLQHTKDRRSTCHGLYLPATFRLQGLATLLTAYSLRARAGFVSHRRRSWDSPFGAFSSREVSWAFPPGCTHLPFRSPVYPAPKHRAGTASRGFWVLTLSGVPGDPRVFSTPAAGCSLGLHPSRACDEGLGQDSARPPLPRFPGRTEARPAAPQRIDQPSPRLIRHHSKLQHGARQPF